MSVGCNSSYSYPPPSPHWVSQQQSYSSAMSAQANPQPPQSILQRKIEDSGGSVGSSYVASSMPAASPYSQQQQIRQNHHQQYSPMSVPIHSGEASAVPSPQMSHRFHQNTPQQHLQSSPPQILGGGPHLQHQTQSAGLQPQTLVGGQNLNQQTFFATQQTSLPGQQQLQPIYHKKLQGRVQFHNQTHQQPQQLPLHYLQTPPHQQLLSQQQHYHHTSPIERPTAPLPTQQNMHPPPSPMVYLC